MNRRRFLSGLAIGGLAAGIWRLESNHVLRVGDGAAYGPWQDWQRRASNPLERLVRAAVLAASPHNTQPWKFHLLPQAVDVYADTSRRLGAMDPLLREMLIGIGCALENLLLSAEADGYGWRLDQPVPARDPALQPVVRVLLQKDNAKYPSELYQAIPKRHTNRAAYIQGKAVDGAVFAALNNLNNSDVDLRVFWFRAPREMQAFGELVTHATEAIISDQEQSSSSARWIRSEWSDIERLRDGLTKDAQGMSAGMRALAKFLPPLPVKQMDRYWLTATRTTQVATASAFGWIAVRDAQNTTAWVEAGRLWQRMHLLATLRRIAMQPLNQPVERRDRELQLGLPPSFADALADLQQDNGWRAVMPFRLGYPTQNGAPSPRRAIASVLV
jgi:hypothetical protein